MYKIGLNNIRSFYCIQGNGSEKPKIMIVELCNGLMYPAVPYIKDQIVLKGKAGKYTFQFTIP